MNKEKQIQEYKSKQLLDELSKMPPMVIATAYLHAINYTLYGTDVTEKWLTAVQQASALERAYQKGYYDALQRQTESEDKEKLSWLGKNCKDCGNGKCKKLGTLPKGYDCALWQPKAENYSIKMVTNAKDAENYPISKGISKGIEEIKKMIFENGQAESEDKK